MGRTFWMLLVAAGFSVLTACGGTAPVSDEGDDADTADVNADETDIAASSTTKAEIGVHQWHVTKTGVVGSDSAGRACVSFRYQSTADATGVEESKVVLDDGNQVAQWAFNVHRRSDGTVEVTDFQRDASDLAAALKTVKLLQIDLDAARARGLKPQSLRPLDIVKEPVPLVQGSGCTTSVTKAGEFTIFVTRDANGEVLGACAVKSSN